MAETNDAIVLEVLRRILTDLGETRREVSSLRDEIHVFKAESASGVGLLGSLARETRRELAGLMAAGNAFVGQIDKRVGSLEMRVTTLEASRP